MEKLTDKQCKVFKFIKDRISLDGLPPTIREIAGHFGFSSTGTVRDYLRLISQKGYIKVSEKKSRAIELVKSAIMPFRVPIAGRVVAGIPEIAFENIEGYLDFETLVPFKDTTNIFALRVKGDSMIEEGIRHNDLVLVRKQPVAQNGDIVVALIDDEATVKKIFYHENRIALKPANPDYETMYVRKDFSIIGKVIYIIRKI